MSNYDHNNNLTPQDNTLATEQDSKFDDASDGSDLLSSGLPLNIRSHWKFKLIGWFGLITSLMFVGFSVNSSLFEGLIAGGMVASMSMLLLILARSSLQVDTQGIVLVRYLARYRIAWEEIKYIEFSTQMDRVVFHGHNKWLVIPRIVPVVSGHKKDFARFLSTQAKQRRIPIDFAEATPSHQKNTRVGNASR